MEREELLERYRSASDYFAAASGMTDAELVAAFNGLCEEPGDPRCDAITNEIQRRDLDL